MDKIGEKSSSYRCTRSVYIGNSVINWSLPDFALCAQPSFAQREEGGKGSDRMSSLKDDFVGFWIVLGRSSLMELCSELSNPI
jgi:hypothetical protein